MHNQPLVCGSQKVEGFLRDCIKESTYLFLSLGIKWPEDFNDHDDTSTNSDGPEDFNNKDNISANSDEPDYSKDIEVEKDSEISANPSSKELEEFNDPAVIVSKDIEWAVDEKQGLLGAKRLGEEWKIFTPFETTFEPDYKLLNCEELIQKFNADYGPFKRPETIRAIEPRDPEKESIYPINKEGFNDVERAWDTTEKEKQKQSRIAEQPHCFSDSAESYFWFPKRSIMPVERLIDFISQAERLQNGPEIITGTPVTAHAVINTFVREGHPGFDETMTLMKSETGMTDAVQYTNRALEASYQGQAYWRDHEDQPPHGMKLYTSRDLKRKVADRSDSQTPKRTRAKGNVDESNHR
uniref:Uncharacterized protein n=1 Tax=Bionectria ochroleuca TaxID=29856 RepID=A0A8H7NHM0_BIOOC